MYIRNRYNVNDERIENPDTYTPANIQVLQDFLNQVYVNSKTYFDSDDE